MIPVQLPDADTVTEMDEADLIKRVGGHEDENEIVNWTEYRLRSDPQGAPVHRSVAMHLKKFTVTGDAVAAEF